MSISEYIDHTILKADATGEEVKKVCEEAIEHSFASVCVNSSRVPLVSALLKGSGVRVCSVVGFPLGASDSATKAFEAKKAIENGADEIDMVINIGRMKEGDREYVRKDIEEVRKASEGKILKVIIETCLLTDDEKAEACLLAKQAGADFVKTSTGFSTGGATVHDVELMRKTVGPSVGVKASGGVRTYRDAISMIEAGANRIGASASVRIAEEENGR